MSEKTVKPKVANIRLKDKQEPITVSGRAWVSGEKEPLLFPTLERQKNGWYSQEAKRIIREYGDRYETISGETVRGGK